MKLKRILAMLIVLAWLVGITSILPTQAQPRLDPTPPVQGSDRAKLHSISTSNGAKKMSRAAFDRTIAARSGAAQPLARLRSTSGKRSASGATAGASTIEQYVQDFEDNWTDTTDPTTAWRFYDNSGSDGGQYLWGKRSCWSVNGFYSAFSAGGGTHGSNRPCDSNYPPNADSQAFWGPFNFTPYITGTVTFYFHGDSEGDSTRPCTGNDDVVFVAAGISTALADLYGSPHCGDFTSSDVYYDSFDLAPSGILGSNTGYLGLLFFSDGDANSGRGFSIDYLSLTLGRASGPTNIYLPFLLKAPPQPQIVPCPDTEPNNNAGVARKLTTVGQTCSGTAGMSDLNDFYSIDLQAGQHISIALTNLPAGTNFDLYLYPQEYLNNTKTPPVQSSANTGNADEHINSYTSPTTQRYYIRIFVRSGAASYHLSVTVT